MKASQKMRFRAQKISGPAQWLRVYLLYRAAFPRCERKPFRMIWSMHRRGKTDVWYCTDERGFAGFAATINADKLILLDYLAVPKRRQNRGNGTRILQALKAHYPDKGIFVEIESPYEDVPDRAARLRRKRFYIACGLTPSRVMASVFEVKMELLCWNCSVDFDGYHAFYRDHYSPWAAQHILREEYPAETNA